MSKIKNVNAIRNGQVINLSVYHLLVGDVVYIQTGQILSVDGIIIESNNLSVNESNITGENCSVKKRIPVNYDISDYQSPFLISGSIVLQGTGIMIVAAVGINSYYEKLKLKIQKQQDETPLQQRLSIMTRNIEKIGVLYGCLIFIIMLFNYISDCYYNEKQFVNFLSSINTVHQFIEYFIITVSIIVLAVPQGLALSVTIGLAYSVDKMREENNLVRHLSGCQVMGEVDNICCDKTGILTTNHMRVTGLFIQQTIYNEIEVENLNISHKTLRILCESICNNTHANPIINNKQGYIYIEQMGNKIECALLEMVYRMGYDYKKHRNKDNIFKIFQQSQNLKITTIYQHNQGKILIYAKAPSQYLFKYCTKFINKNGQQMQIDQKFKQKIQQTIKKFADSSLQTLLLVYKQIDYIKQQQQKQSQIQNNFIIIGLAGIKDPLRKGIAQAIKTCSNAGIRIRMLTGNNKTTAISIAKQAGILAKGWKQKQNDFTVMQGKQFRQFVGGLVNQGTQYQAVGNIQNFKIVRDQLLVLAKSTSYDKYLITTGLKQLHHVIAMTGDGTGDVPALRKADIGLAMGIDGTDVAKQASQIILLDDNFRSIVTAIKWGRNIFDAIRKFLQFQLTVNLVALTMTFIGVSLLHQCPLNAIQMLWINLIMDTLASLALATQPPNDKLLERKPYSRYENLITNEMKINIISHGIWQIFVLCFVLFRLPQILNIPSSIKVTEWNNQTGKHYSMFFNVFVFLQIFNQINARKLNFSEINIFDNFFNNPLFLIVIIGSGIVQLILIKYGGKSIKTVQLTLNQNIFCILLGSTSLLYGLMIRILFTSNLLRKIFNLNQQKFNINKQ